MPIALLDPMFGTGAVTRPVLDKPGGTAPRCAQVEKGVTHLGC